MEYKYNLLILVCAVVAVYIVTRISSRKQFYKNPVGLRARLGGRSSKVKVKVLASTGNRKFYHVQFADGTTFVAHINDLKPIYWEL